MEEKPRLTRLTSIVTLLQAKRLITASFLADKFNVSVRTIYRDIRTLEQSGIPIVTEEGKGYTLLEGYQLPPIMFTEEEANALITAEQLIARNKDQSLVESYHNAITKIKAVLRTTQKDTVALLAERVIFRANLDQEKTSNYLMTLQAAITNYSILNINYLSLSNVQTNRSIEPFALYSTQENWLLISFCRLRKEFRVFRVDLIQDLKLTDSYFEPHKITLQEYFDQCSSNY